MTPEEMEATIMTMQNRIDALEHAASLVAPRAVTPVTASEVTRGRIILTEGGSGVADTVTVILKAAGGTYSAVTVATG